MRIRSYREVFRDRALWRRGGSDTGLPLSGIIGRKEIFDSMLGGTIGGTYVGNLIACRAGIEVLKIIEEEKLLDRAVAMGKVIRERFEEMKRKYAIIGDVHGLGALLGMELVKDPVSKVPAKDECAGVLAQWSDHSECRHLWERSADAGGRSHYR